jgi:glycosyltransferase involved in cell wall biosynthesis
MTDGKRLCLNMIVKNEMANLGRCLAALADRIGCWVIGDTGSSDGTQDFIIAFFAERNLPGELHSFPFHNFEQHLLPLVIALGSTGPTKLPPIAAPRSERGRTERLRQQPVSESQVRT